MYFSFMFLYFMNFSIPNKCSNHKNQDALIRVLILIIRNILHLKNFNFV